MYNFRKAFFSKARARAFKAELKELGIEADIWSDRDGFGQTQYIVCWNDK